MNSELQLFDGALCSTCLQSQAELVDPAVEGTLNILRSCARTPSIRRIVMTSSSAAVRVNDTYAPGAVLDDSSWSSLEFCEKHKVLENACTSGWSCSKNVNFRMSHLVSASLVNVQSEELVNSD